MWNHSFFAAAFTLLLGVCASTAGWATTYAFSTPTYARGDIENNGKLHYTTSMRVSGTFTLSEPPAANLDNERIESKLQTWKFYDGLHTFTPANSAVRVFVDTDAAGSITACVIIAVSPKGPYFAGQRIDSMSFGSTAYASSGEICTEETKEGICDTMVQMYRRAAHL